MGYEQFLLYICNLKGISFSPISVAKNGTHEIVGIEDEFIATRNGMYIVKATAADKTTAEIKINITGIEEEKFSTIYTETTLITDKNGAVAKIPAGFAVGISNNINTVENGLVITDAVDSNGYSIGNEFVWIPVNNENDLKTTNFDANGNPTAESVAYGNSIEDCSEPYASGYSDGNGTEELADYNKMKEKVLEHKGFYIARYEAGVNTAKINPWEPADKSLVIKKGVAPFNNVPWGDDMDNIGTEGAVYLSKSIYANSSSVTSTLIYGCQWDAMCRFIEDSYRTTPKKDGVGLTGGIGSDKSKNIYDLAGNCYEWTMEARGTWRSHRGGCAGYEVPVYYRSSTIVADRAGYYSFRPALYIK